MASSGVSLYHEVPCLPCSRPLWPHRGATPGGVGLSFSCTPALGGTTAPPLQTCPQSDEGTLHPRQLNCSHHGQRVSAFSAVQLGTSLPVPTSGASLPKSKSSLWSLPGTGSVCQCMLSSSVNKPTLPGPCAVHQTLFLLSPMWVSGSLPPCSPVLWAPELEGTEASHGPVISSSL